MKKLVLIAAVAFAVIGGALAVPALTATPAQACDTNNCGNGSGGQ